MSCRSLPAQADGSLSTAGDDLSFDWETLVAKVAHPIGVEIIEALIWIGKPLSAKLLESLFDDEEDHYLTRVSYHVRKLAKTGVIEVAGWREVRGSRETFYFFTPDTLH